MNKNVPLTEMQKKFKIVSDLFDLAMKRKSHQLKLKFPNLTEQQIRLKVIEMMDQK